ncbi:MAG: hypothetical protein IT460_12330 [Planctomycetes bacterium]|nr:hypothetical protein [Planctomycetota bacterium]
MIRTVLVGAAVLAPPGVLAWALVAWGRPEPGTWALFLPLLFVWLAAIDLRFGVSARLARPSRRRPRA